MSITVAKTAGFCFGVRRAVELAERQAQANGVIYAYGEIIHNMHEIARLERRGCAPPTRCRKYRMGQGPDPRAWCAAVGISNAAGENCEVFDATCPFVQKNTPYCGRTEPRGTSYPHPRKRRPSRGCWHPGMVRRLGRTRERSTGESLFGSAGFDGKRTLAVVAQTTVNRNLWNISVGLIKKRCTNLKIFDTICKATDERQSRLVCLPVRRIR